MQDNLTTRIQEELARRGRVVSQDHIRSVLAKTDEPAVDTGTNRQLEALSKIPGLPGAQLPNAQQSDVENVAINAIGATLWSLGNTAAFGIPGAFVTEEDYLDFEDPYAKWGAAFGGFGGFVFGAPMKVGAKAVSMIAKPFISKVGKKSVDTIVRGVKNSSHIGGVDKKVIREITGGYKSLAMSAQKNPALRGEAFKTKSVAYITSFLRKAEANGDITAKQAQGILKAFGDDFMKRPLQDFIGVVQASGVLANSPRAMRVLGHSINDALMFGMIDTVFEGFSTFEDHEFDWTAPLWGVATGSLFGQLSWMNPRGKGASWWRDWKKGIQASFAKTPYEGMAMEQMVTRAKLMAESAGKNRITRKPTVGEAVPPRGPYVRKTITGKEVQLNAEPKIEWKGKEYEIDFNRKDLGKWLTGKFGDDAADVLRKALDKERVAWGKEIRHWANRESFENVGEAWFRMTAGGVVFNAHTFYDMYAHGYEAEMADILPHFLIGAYVQRYSNPAKFDINSRQINRVRENLMLLGFSPDQLRSIPSFDYVASRLNDPLTAEKYNSIRGMAKDMNLVGDRAEDVDIKLGPGKVSVEMRPNEWFDRIYEYLKRSGKVPRTKDQISVEEANAIVSEFKRLEPSVKTLKDLEVLFDEAYLVRTQEFEDTLYQLVDTVRKADENRELEIHFDENKPRENNRVPDFIDISEELIRKAKDGELDWIADKDNPYGDLRDTIEGFLSVMQTLSFAQRTKSIPDGKTRTITSEELLKKVYEETRTSETVVESEFPNRNFGADRFSFKHDHPDYLDAITRNTAIQVSKEVYSIFRKSYPEYEELSGLLTDVGLLSGKDTIGEIRSRAALIKNINQIEITGTKDGTTEAAELKQFLGRILSIAAASGTYGRQQGKPKTDKIAARDIKKLKKFMDKRSRDIYSMKGYLHEHMVNYILRDRIKRTDLRVDQVEALFNLSELGFADLSFAVEGKATGFSIRLVDETVVPSSENAGKMGSIARSYNRYAKKIIKDSNGLVREDVDLIKVVDAQTMLDIDLALPSTNGGVSARGKLLKVMNALPGEYGPTVRQMGLFMQEGGTNRLTKWLIQAGIIEPKKKQSSKYSVTEASLKKFNKEFAATLKDRMDTYGSSQKMAEEQYQRDVKFARDQIYRDLDEIGYDRHITLQEFFKLYRIDGLDMESFSAEERMKAWDDLVYESKDNRLLHDGVLDQVLDRIHVEKGKDKTGNKKYKPFRELSDKEQKHGRKEVLYNLTGLFATQRAQIKIPVIKYQNGDIKEGYEFQQATRHTDYLERDLNMPFYIVDNMAAVYEMVDGRYTRLVLVDVFGESANLTKAQNKVIRQHKNVFKNLLSVRERLFGDSIRGEGDEMGVQVMRLFPQMSPIAIESRHLVNVEKPFIKFAKVWGKSPSLTEGVKKNINRIRESFEVGEGVYDEREYALRVLSLNNWLNSGHKGLGGGGKKFIEILNTDMKDIDKQLGRAKLYDTKRFVRNDLPFVIDIARAYESIGDTETYRVFRKFANKKGFGVAIWNDAEFARVKDQIADQLKEQGITNWDYENVMGDAHAETSAFDSISFVTKDVMRYGHTSVGHNPNSLNPYKPIISSSGTSALLMGKTLFVYSPELDNFFKANPTTDILMTKTGAKLFNESGKPTERDPSIINEPYTELIGKNPIAYAAGDKVRFISLESLGILPSKDSSTSTAPRAQSDYNFMSNNESAVVWEGEYRYEVEGGIARVENILSSPWVMNEWVRRQIGTSNLISDPAANIGSAQYSNLVYYAGLGRDMNPMSHSPRKMKNQLFDIYLNSIINRMRSTSYGQDEDNGQRYGGQSTLIQVPRFDHRLNSTLVDRDGVMIVRGEVLLPSHEARMRLDELTSDGRDIRFVRGGEVFTAEEIFKLFTDGNASEARELWEAYKTYSDLGTLQEMIQIHIKEGDIPEGTQIGIIVNRKPRTRPNDMTIVGLKGFLEKAYGNSVTLGSLDVANIFEGDYDADKIDYFMASRSGMYDHVERASKFFVQGIDPSNLRTESKFTFGGKVSDVNQGIEDMAANTDLFSRNIGVVQKIPRKLGYMEKLSYMDIDDPFVRNLVRKDADGNSTAPRILFEIKDQKGVATSKILFDYNNLDFFTRAALETQYIIDGQGRINNQISSDITSWHDRFLFPTKENSLAPGDVTTGKIGFVNDLRDKGHSVVGGENKRVRVFRKVKFDPLTGEFHEVNLNNAEKAVIKALLSEYGKLLNAAGKKMFEKSGTQRSINYDDVMEASQRFFDFHNNISDNIYKTLKNRVIDPSKKGSKKWQYDDDFKDMFGIVKDKFYSKKDRKEVEFWKATKSIVGTTVRGRANEVSRGERGAPLDRILYQVKEADLFEDIRTKTATGDIVKVMDDWYRSMIAGDEYSSEIAAARIRKGVIAAAGKINKSVDIIINLKKKLWAVKNNDKIPYKARKDIVAKMNEEIKLNEKAISKFIPMEYWKTRKGADLKRMQFVAVDDREVKEGAIQYATMRNIRRILPLIGDSPNWGLGAKALKDLKEIKTLRQFFYSNRDNLADVLQYGDKTLLSEEKRNYLKNTPDLSSFNEVESKLLMDGYTRYGPAFIYAFMAPVADNYKIGIFEGEPLPVPYAATTRYSKGLQFLTNVAKEVDIMSATMRDVLDQPFNLSKDALRLHQTIEKGFNDYFNRKTAMKEIRYEYKQIISEHGFDLPDANPFEGISFKQIRVPNFSKDFERMFTSYRDIKWARDTKRKTTGFEMMNDHLIDFYADIMKLAGKEAEFESYINSMNELTSKMIENEIIDPIEYMAIRSTMDREVRRIARDVITGEIMQDRDNISVKNLLKNPVYALMGGPDFFKGLALEKTAKFKPSRLKSLRRMYDNLEAYDHKLQVSSKSEKDRIRKIREACFGGA